MLFTSTFRCVLHMHGLTAPRTPLLRSADAKQLRLPLLSRKADGGSSAAPVWAAFDGPSTSGDGAAPAPDYLSDIGDG